MKKLNLTKRLLAIINLVDETVIADIGADHGKLSAKLLQDEKVNFCYITDISEKCLEKSRGLIAKNNLNSKVDLRIGDGLTVFGEEVNAQTIIAGMGGKEIINILSNPLRKDKICSFILQPQKNVCEVRNFLINNGYVILADICVEDNGKFYSVIKTHYSPDSKQNLNHLQITFGLTNLIQRNIDFSNFIKLELEKFSKILNNTQSEKIMLYYQDLLKAETIIKKLEE